MSKRGPKPKGALTGIFSQLNPEVMREVFAVVLLVLGIMGLLSIFNAAGRFGERIETTLNAGFGIVGYFFPVIFLFWGLYLFLPEKLAGQKKYAWGILIAFLLLCGLFHPYGGRTGEILNVGLEGLLGKIGTYIVLVGVLVVDLLLTFSFSLKEIFAKIRMPQLPRRKSEEAGVSVFSTVRRQVELPGLETWKPLPLDILESPSGKVTSGNIAKNVEMIQKTLADFGIEVSMGDVNVGPTVTQYELKPAEGIKLNQITARSDDLALALAVHPIRVEAPIPGKSAVGVEVPNKVPVTVTLREVLESDIFKKRKSNLTLPLGRDVSGGPVTADLKRMPHLLIAGATGSGKSVCINAMMTALMYQNSPAELRFLLVDPKRVEFTAYNGIPYLLAPVVTEVDKTINLLKWAVAEMDRRFQIFSQSGARNIELYNEMASKGGGRGENQPIPYIVIFIDELADLMAQAANEVEAAIVRLAQLARATGIHLVVATQRPSVDVITGLIKANITARIAFTVASQVDSRTIIDMSGAEKLLGNGDLLFIGPDTGKPRRVQGVMLLEKEINTVCSFLKESGETYYDESIVEFRPEGVGYTGGGVEVDDPLYEDAMQLAVQAGKASASLMQRRLKVGYARAARLLDILEENGIIGPADGAKPRDVLIDTLELDSRRVQKQKRPVRQLPEPTYYRFDRRPTEEDRRPAEEIELKGDRQSKAVPPAEPYPPEQAKENGQAKGETKIVSQEAGTENQETNKNSEPSQVPPNSQEPDKEQ